MRMNMAFKLSDDEREHLRQSMYNFINHNCIKRVKPGEKLMPGLHPPNMYSWLILSRYGLMNATFMRYLGFLFWDLFYDEYQEQPFQLGGLETACIPMITAINMTAANFGIENVNSFYLRKKPKEYGIFQTFEGYVFNDQPVVVVDDFYNSRSTYMTVKENLDKHNVPLHKKAFALINKDRNVYEPNTPDDELRILTKKTLENLEIISLFKITDFDLSYYDYTTKFHPNEPIELV
jgi:orotate phosphoribosyltransferase